MPYGSPARDRERVRTSGREAGPHRHRHRHRPAARWRASSLLAAVVVTALLAGLAAALFLDRERLAVGGAPPDLTGARSVAGLDGSGSTVPTTDLPVPDGAVFLSTTGEDGSAGTRDAPVRSLARAWALAPAGGTVAVRGGTYRDGNLDTAKPVSLQAFPGEQPWFDGTDVVTDWTVDGAGHWYVGWSTPDFCRNAAHPAGGYYSQTWPWLGEPAAAGPCIHSDMADDPANPAAADPQMVFVDGVALRQETTLSAVSSTSFFHDAAARRIYTGASPEGHTVEVTRRPVALVLRAPSGLQVRGIGFRRYATNEKHEASVTHAAVSVVSTPDVVVSDSAFSQNAGAGLAFIGGPKRALVDHSVFAENGANGVDGNGSQEDDDFTLSNNLFDRNNAELFGRGCRASCSAAASKLAHMDHLTVKDNVFRDSQGEASGFWCDLHCSRTVIVGNVASGNGNVGLFYEVSESAVIASNLVYGNGYYAESRRPDGTGGDGSNKGSGIRLSASQTKVYNNTVVDNVADLVVYDDERSPGAGCAGCDPHAVGPDTRDVQVANNIFSGVSPVSTHSWLVGSFRRAQRGVAGTGPEDFFTTMDANSYYRHGGVPEVLQVWEESDAVGVGDGPKPSSRDFTSISGLHAATGLERTGQEFTGAADPFFVDASRGRYCVRSGGATSVGLPLPADVAAAMGLAAGTTSVRGAPAWLGQDCP